MIGENLCGLSSTTKAVLSGPAMSGLGAACIKTKSLTYTCKTDMEAQPTPCHVLHYRGSDADAYICISGATLGLSFSHSAMHFNTFGLGRRIACSEKSVGARGLLAVLPVPVLPVRSLPNSEPLEETGLVLDPDEREDLNDKLRVAGASLEHFKHLVLRQLLGATVLDTMPAGIVWVDSLGSSSKTTTRSPFAYTLSTFASIQSSAFMLRTQIFTC